MEDISPVEYAIKQPTEDVYAAVNNTDVNYPSEKTLHALFEEQVEKHPDQIAGFFRNEVLSYSQLNSKANQLAALLRNKGVGPDKVVAIMVERSFEMLIGIFSILKAGGAYLPVSPNDPAKRIEFMLEDSKAEILLTQESLKEQLSYTGEVIYLEDEAIYNGPTANLQPVNQATDLAYIIYTSGSTGKPKGVMIEHSSVVNRLKWMQRQYPINEGDILLQKTSFCFDVSVWELFWWALEGASVALLIPGGEKIPLVLVEAVNKYKVTVMHFVPSMLNVFLDYIEDSEHIEKLISIKRIFSSGEALTPSHVKKFNKILYQSHQILLTNLYGPTEATVDVSFYDCPPGKDLIKVPIGKPIDNSKFFVIQNQISQEIGMPGELCISGVGIARGYLNREDLTKEKFVDNPFLPGKKMYKTGDLVQWMPDGNLEFLGRIDYQVKIRGLRIELMEIEAMLLTNEAVKECVVVAKEVSESVTMIIAYLVLKENSSAEELKKYLKAYLPDYMIPNVFMKLDQLPLNQNGKIDRNALPELSIEVAGEKLTKSTSVQENRTLPFTKEELETIIEKFPTPFHIYDEQRLIDTARRLKKAFSWHPGFRQYFALKATPNPNILKVLNSEGFGADCSSLTELVLSEKCGIKGENIMFSANVPPPVEFQKARELNAIINLDDITHIHFLESVAGLPEVISLRYNPGNMREGNVFLGKLSEAKFGFTREQLFDGYKILKEKGVKRFGLHTMIATQVLDPAFFIRNAQMLLDLALDIAETVGIQFEFINLGGGIGIPYRPHEKAVDLEYVGEGVRKIYEKTILEKGHAPINIYMECGRMMTGPSGYMVAKVIHKKSTYKNYIGLDASMANLMRIGMYGEYHHITVMGKEHLPAEHVYDIIGSLCENNDKFAINRLLPKIDLGDIIVIHDTGAHGHAMGFNYNGKLRSGELLLRTTKEVVQIRRPESLEDHLSTLLYVM